MTVRELRVPFFKDVATGRLPLPPEDDPIPMKMEEVLIGLSGLLVLLIKQIFFSGASSKGQRPYNKNPNTRQEKHSFELLDKVVQETLKT